MPGDLPEGSKDKTVLVEDRLRDWLALLYPGQRFTYYQALRCIGGSKEPVRKGLNKLQEEGLVEYVGHERSHLWRRVG